MKSKIEIYIAKAIMLPFMLALLFMAAVQKIKAFIKNEQRGILKT